jgi:hypothetical protein
MTWDTNDPPSSLKPDVTPLQRKLIDVTLPQIAMMSSTTKALKMIQILEDIAGPIVIPRGKTLRLQVELVDQPAEYPE